MYTVSTRIARGGFSLVLTAPSPSKARVHYFAVGSGGRQTSGSVTLEGCGETFVALDFPVLAVGVTDVEIEEAPAAREFERPRAGHAPAVATFILSSILAAGGIAASHAQAPATDHSPQWRNAQISAAAAGPDLMAAREYFVASG